MHTITRYGACWIYNSCFYAFYILDIPFTLRTLRMELNEINKLWLRPRENVKVYLIILVCSISRQWSISNDLIFVNYIFHTIEIYSQGKAFTKWHSKWPLAILEWQLKKLSYMDGVEYHKCLKRSGSKDVYITSHLACVKYKQGYWPSFLLTISYLRWVCIWLGNAPSLNCLALFAQCKQEVWPNNNTTVRACCMCYCTYPACMMRCVGLYVAGQVDN